MGGRIKFEVITVSHLRYCTVVGNCTFARYVVGWEWDNMMFSVTIWMGMGERDLLGNDLDGISNSDLSR